jgi:sugar lactone lactonase YvrE
MERAERAGRMSALTIFADDGNLCGEGPIWDFEEQQLYWTDSVGLKVYRCSWDSKTHECIRDGLEVNGIALDQSGGLVVTNNSGIWQWDAGGELQLIAAEVDGSKCRMNDCIADPQGRLLSGSWFYSPDGNYDLGKLISIETDGTPHILDEGFHLPNGLGFSPDLQTLYFTDSIARQIFAYDYNVASGTLSHPRTFVTVPKTEGLPDGLTVDAEGFVWSAQWYGQRVVRYDPDGKPERYIETPAKQTSSLAFGGPYLTDIFITSAAQSEPMPVMPPGYDANRGFFGGPLYHINLAIEGKKEFLTKIQPRPQTGAREQS